MMIYANGKVAVAIKLNSHSWRQRKWNEQYFNPHLFRFSFEVGDEKFVYYFFFFFQRPMQYLHIAGGLYQCYRISVCVRPNWTIVHWTYRKKCMIKGCKLWGMLVANENHCNRLNRIPTTKNIIHECMLNVSINSDTVIL